MDLISIVFLLGFFVYRNCARAKEKGVSVVLWGFLTVLLMFVGFFIGYIITFLAIFRGVLDMHRLETDKVKYSEELALEFQQAVISNPVHSLAIMGCALGGYLFTRYLLSTKKTPEKLGEI